MNLSPTICFAVALSFLAGCDWMPGKPAKEDRPLLPSQVMEFGQLYARNCAGCHGAEGKLGAALPLNDPVYLAWAGKENLVRITSEGVPDSAMPGFAATAGGTLTGEQIEALIDQMLTEWGRPSAGTEAGLPPYDSPEGSGDPVAGAEAYRIFCEHCHGENGAGGPNGGSVVDGSYLALVSDRALRTVVVAGRQSLGMPNWRGYVPDRPMTPQEIDHVVAWMASMRKPYPGQPYTTRTMREP